MRPLRIVVNPASGGGQGADLAVAAALALGEDRVVDLRRPGWDSAIRLAESERGAVIACGGDGTVAAVGEAVWRAGLTAQVPVGIIPLGTGNDLARALGWNTLPIHALNPATARLAELAAAGGSSIDRWVLHHPGGTLAFYAYFSIGYDAAVAGRFHRARLAHPRLFLGGLVNAGWYAAAGLAERHHHLALASTPALPDGAGALLLLNVPSYAGGRFKPGGVDRQDGRIDLYASAGGWSFGMALASGRLPSLGGFTAWEGELAHETTMQIDGEPMAAPPGRYRVEHGGSLAVLVRG